MRMIKREYKKRLAKIYSDYNLQDADNVDDDEFDLIMKRLSKSFYQAHDDVILRMLANYNKVSKIDFKSYKRRLLWYAKEKGIIE